MKRCPFCKESKVELTLSGNDYTKKRSATIHCKNCNTKMTVGALRHNLQWCEDTVRKQWNTRPIEDELAEYLKWSVEEVLSHYELSGFDLALWSRVEEALEKARGGVMEDTATTEYTILVDALEWYAETVSKCNRKDSSGDAARDRLAKDVGGRAKRALEKARVE